MAEPSWRAWSLIAALKNSSAPPAYSGAPESCATLRREADSVVCLVEPSAFRAVGLWYEDFDQTSDEEVHSALEAS